MCSAMFPHAGGPRGCMPPMAGPQSQCDLNTTHMAWETHSRAIGMTGGVFSPAPHGEDAPRQDGRRGAAAERDAHVSPGALPPEGVHPDAGTQSAGLPVPPGATSEQVALGKRIFHGEVAGATCAGCHGADGIGTPVGADLASGTWLWGDGSLKSITDIIRSGVPQPKQHPGAMPPFGGVQLSESDLAALAAYVWAIGHRTKG